MKKIAFLNPKGGVGKTTSVINIGAGLANSGKRILLIDMDPQEHLTYSLGMEGKKNRNIFQLLTGEIRLEEVVVQRGKMDIIPASQRLEELEMKLAYIKKSDLLKNYLKFLNGYDYVLIDCPPNLNILTQNAMVAADEIYIPVQTEFLALQGMGRITNILKKIRKRNNPKLKIAGIIGTRFDSRKNLSKDVVLTIREFFGEKLFNSLVSDNIDLAVAPSYRKTIFEYKPNSKGAKDYMKICEEILKRDLDQKEPSPTSPTKENSFINLIKKDLDKHKNKKNKK